MFANTVVASVGSISGRASMTVLPGALAIITVVPTPVTLAVTGTQQFTAVGRDAGGNIVTFTPTWSVVAGGGAITQAGIFTAGAVPGTYTNTVQASNNTLRGFATVTVTVGPLATITVTPNPVTLPATSTQQFVAVGRDASGNVFVIAPTWAIVNGGGSLDVNGLFTAGAVAGTFNNTVRATSGSISGTATVTVTVAPPPPLPAFVNLGTAQTKAIFGSTAVTCGSASTIGTAPGNGDVSNSPAGAWTPGTCTFLGTLDRNTGTSAVTRLDVINAFNILNTTLPRLPANVVAGLGGGAPLVCSAILSPCVYWSGSSIAYRRADARRWGDIRTRCSSSWPAVPSTANCLLHHPAEWRDGEERLLGCRLLFNLKTGSVWQGNILADQSIDMNTGATLLGRALAINGAVTLTTRLTPSPCRNTGARWGRTSVRLQHRSRSWSAARQDFAGRQDGTQVTQSYRRFTCHSEYS